MLNNSVRFFAVVFLACISVLYGLAGWTDVDPGEVTLQIKKLGSDRGMSSETLDTGTYWVEPFRYDVATYDTRLQQYVLQDVASTTKDGQPIVVDISLEIGLIDKVVPDLHETVGKNWYDQVVYPATRSAIRNNTSKLLSDEIYTGTGRNSVQQGIQATLDDLAKKGIKISVNLRDISFTNAQFNKILETKARAAQQVIVKEREAEAAKNEAIRVANIAEGKKQETIKKAEAESERLRLQGLGERKQKVEIAKGILAIKKAEAEGARLLTRAYTGAGAKYVAQIEWAKNLGPNVKVWGVPTGAPGTNSLMDLNGVLKGAFAGK